MVYGCTRQGRVTPPKDSSSTTVQHSRRRSVSWLALPTHFPTWPAVVCAYPDISHVSSTSKGISKHVKGDITCNGTFLNSFTLHCLSSP